MPAGDWGWTGHYGWLGGERYYHCSDGCIILHRKDLLDLKDKWQTYVLDALPSESDAVGVPLLVQYSGKPVTDPNNPFSK